MAKGLISNVDIESIGGNVAAGMDNDGERSLAGIGNSGAGMDYGGEGQSTVWQVWT